MKQGLVRCTLQEKLRSDPLSKGKPTDSSKQISTAHQGPGRNGGSFVAWGLMSRLPGICNLGNFSEQLPAESRTTLNSGPQQPQRIRVVSASLVVLERHSRCVGIRLVPT